MADVLHQIFFGQRLEGNGGPVLSGQGVHGNGFFGQALFRQLTGALNAGTKEQQRQSLQSGVAVLGLPEQVEGLASISLS